MRSASHATTTAKPLLSMLDGFRRTMVLATAVRLGLFDVLAQRGPMSAKELGAALVLRKRPALMLVTACVSLGLLIPEEDGERFGNSPISSRYLVSSEPFWLGGFVRLIEEQQYPAWGELFTALRENRPTVWSVRERSAKFATAGVDEIELFWKAMRSLSRPVADTVARSFDFAPHRGLLDVGGGPGELAVRLCRLHPALRATVFDLPPVCALTAGTLKQAGLDDRIAVHPGDLIADETLPGGYDVITLSNVLHMFDRDTNERILRKCHAALDGGGTLIIVEAFVEDDGTGPADAALMCLNMLVDTVGGGNHTRAEYESMLAGAGFTFTERLPLDQPVPSAASGLLVARKAEDRS
ncbi:methyltransferase [Streptomyces sp. NA02950]|uniref:methyltransferase n=1 Tax=Streptomyces sp. NA02950 TaxID=2742137 RepID=UPI00159200D6|nr:methyltransferase [Streptomyces sp. NA02950]QKV97190.1 methyltransferase [Streptomyces sp. NA02950]